MMETENNERPKEKRWYVLRAISGQEKKVKEYIENETVNLKLEDFIFQVLIPSEKVYQVRNGKKYSKERSFFPGYVLVDCILSQMVQGILRNIPGVLGFLGETRGGDPLPIRESEANRILGKVDEMQEDTAAIDTPYEIGENVKVIDGPFNTFIGIIEDINEEKKKLKVMVKIFGRKTPLELSFVQVEKLKE
jgi:transcriptional antiterminator NusG